VARKIMKRLLKRAGRERLLSKEHFSVDGTLIEAWAAVKSMRRRDGGDEPPPPGRNPSWISIVSDAATRRMSRPVDPEAKLARKGDGQAAKLSYQGHVLMEHRHGLVVDVELTAASGTAEREAALKMLDRQRARGRRTLAADKGYDTREFVAALRERQVTPQVAQNINRRGGTRDRCTHDAPCWLPAQSVLSQTHRGVLRLGQAGSIAAPAQTARPSQGRLAHGAEHARLQHGAHGQAAAGPDLGQTLGNGRTSCQYTGLWNICACTIRRRYRKQ
jgi:hypothetical protein